MERKVGWVIFKISQRQKKSWIRFVLVISELGVSNNSEFQPCVVAGVPEVEWLGGKLSTRFKVIENRKK